MVTTNSRHTLNRGILCRYICFPKSAFNIKYLAKDNGKTVPMVEIRKKCSYENAYQWSDTVDFMFSLYLHCISDINGSKWFSSIHVCLVVSQNVVFQNKPSAFPISPERKNVYSKMEMIMTIRIEITQRFKKKMLLWTTDRSVNLIDVKSRNSF